MDSNDLTFLDILGVLAPLATYILGILFFAWMLIQWARSMQPASAAKWNRHMEESPLHEAPITDAPITVDPRPWKKLAKPAPAEDDGSHIQWCEVWEWNPQLGRSVLVGLKIANPGGTTAPETPRRREPVAITATTPLSAGSN